MQGQGGSPLAPLRPQVRHQEALSGQAQHDRHCQQHQVRLWSFKPLKLLHNLTQVLMCCGFPFQDWNGALVWCEGGEDLQVRPDKTFTFLFMMNNVSRLLSLILGHNPPVCQYCFMFVKNVDGVPSELASFARRPQSTIYLKTINCGEQNLINKCHRWKEWKYVNSGLAFSFSFFWFLRIKWSI